MTYKESLEQAFLKTDSEKGDYEAGIFPALAHEAQMYIAMYGTHIKRTDEITVQAVNGDSVAEGGNIYTLPDDFYRFDTGKIVYRDSPRISAAWHMTGSGTVAFEQTGTYLLKYWAKPQDLTQMTDEERDGYTYEVAPETHVAIPFYIGYQLVKTDDVQLAQMLLNEWNKYMSLFDDAVKAAEKRITNAVRWW